MDAGARAGDGDDSGEAPFDVNAEEQAWDEAMHQALNLARAEGKLPGGVEETVKGAHASTLDPYSLLRRYMTDTARRDYSWSQPNRRFIDSGLYLPAMHSEAMGTIVILLDTSGSIYSYLDILARFWTEVREVVHELNPERLIVLQVDTRVADVAEYASEELPDALEAKGGGGTDFRPGFAWLEAEGIEPACCLYFTDMQCSSYPETEPGFPVIWANTGTRRPTGTGSPGASASTSPPKEQRRDPRDSRRPCRGAQAGARSPRRAVLLDRLDRRSRPSPRDLGERPVHARRRHGAAQGRAPSRRRRRPGRGGRCR